MSSKKFFGAKKLHQYLLCFGGCIRDFDAETYARQAFGITGGEKPLKARALFKPKLAVSITECQRHRTQESRKRPDSRVELRLETTGRKELIRRVCSWMPDVKLLAPKSLRDRII